MLENAAPWAVWTLGVVQALGLGSAYLARKGQGSLRQSLSQRAFFGGLCLVGASTLYGLFAMGPGVCLACGMTLATMLLGVTWETNSAPR